MDQQQEAYASVPMDWNVAAGVAEVAFAYVLYAHWRASGRAWPAWTLRLSDSRRALLRWLRLNTQAQLETLADTLRVARAKHEEGGDDKALRVIAQADKLAALHVRLLRTWLQCWTDVTGMLGLAPASPPSMPATPTAAVARLTPLRWLRWAGHLGDLLLPTHSSRFRLSVRLQRAALQCVGWNTAAARLRARQPGQIGPALDELEATRAVLVALDEQALATLDRLLHALPDDGPLR